MVTRVFILFSNTYSHWSQHEKHHMASQKKLNSSILSQTKSKTEKQRKRLKSDEATSKYKLKIVIPLSVIPEVKEKEPPINKYHNPYHHHYHEHSKSISDNFIDKSTKNEKKTTLSKHVSTDQKTTKKRDFRSVPNIKQVASPIKIGQPKVAISKDKPNENIQKLNHPSSELSGKINSKTLKIDRTKSISKEISINEMSLSIGLKVASSKDKYETKEKKKNEKTEKNSNDWVQTKRIVADIVRNVTAKQDEQNTNKEMKDVTFEKLPTTVIRVPALVYSNLNPPISKFSEDKQNSRLSNTSVSRSPKLNTESQMSLAFAVNKAVQQKKIFSMTRSTYPSFAIVRAALIKRGWLQKYDCKERALRTETPPQDPETKYIQHLLRATSPNLAWVRCINDWTDLKPTILVNRFPRAPATMAFTTKIGLNQYLQQSYWYNEKGVAGVKFPRTHSILKEEDLTSFVEDYILTACTCLLKHVVMSISQSKNDIFQNGDIPFDIIDFAIDRCNEYAAFREHKDLDKRGKPIKQDDKNTKRFLTNFYKLIHEGKKFKAPDAQVNEMYINAKSALIEIQKFWPELKLDGIKNLWIVKQSNLNRGKGVKILSTLNDILTTIGQVKRPRYVIQKYIERPLLIYETKFDIRQWILLTAINPIEIWMYEECYLRFSSQLFTLDDTSESIHLCNNVIQKKYVNVDRNPALPLENMWDSVQFKSYLREIGYYDKWEKVIYPGMKESIIATIMAAQECLVVRESSFELYGADFMLTEDFRPWLIEINSAPAMGPTTSVTNRLCSQCLNDIIKVVIDRRYSPQADTGLFRLIYKQQSPACTYALAADFQVTGKRISLQGKKRKQQRSTRKEPVVIELSETKTGRKLVLKDSPSKNVINTFLPSKTLISDNFQSVFEEPGTEVKVDKKFAKSEKKEICHQKDIHNMLNNILSEVPCKEITKITKESRTAAIKENVHFILNNLLPQVAKNDYNISNYNKGYCRATDDQIDQNLLKTYPNANVENVFSTKEETPSLYLPKQDNYYIESNQTTEITEDDTTLVGADVQNVLHKLIAEIPHRVRSVRGFTQINNHNSSTQTDTIPISQGEANKSYLDTNRQIIKENDNWILINNRKSVSENDSCLSKSSTEKLQEEHSKPNRSSILKDIDDIIRRNTNKYTIAETDVHSTDIVNKKLMSAKDYVAEIDDIQKDQPGIHSTLNNTESLLSKKTKFINKGRQITVIRKEQTKLTEKDIISLLSILSTVTNEERNKTTSKNTSFLQKDSLGRCFAETNIHSKLQRMVSEQRTDEQTNGSAVKAEVNTIKETYGRINITIVNEFQNSIHNKKKQISQTDLRSGSSGTNEQTNRIIKKEQNSTAMDNENLNVTVVDIFPKLNDSITKLQNIERTKETSSKLSTEDVNHLGDKKLDKKLLNSNTTESQIATGSKENTYKDKYLKQLLLEEPDILKETVNESTNTEKQKIVTTHPDTLTVLQDLLAEAPDMLKSKPITATDSKNMNTTKQDENWLHGKLPSVISDLLSEVPELFTTKSVVSSNKIIKSNRKQNIVNLKRNSFNSTEEQSKSETQNVYNNDNGINTCKDNNQNISDNQLQFIGYKIISGMQPMRYKILYNRDTSSYIVDVE